MVRRRIFQVGNICALCGETYSRSLLYKCSQCGLMYCGNCVLFKDDKIVCLRCAVKSVSPKTPRSKYMHLSIFLAEKSKYKDEVALSFAEVEEIIGDKLPKSAYEDKRWWSNVRGRSPSEAWMTVGWIVKDVDFEKKEVTFSRERKETVNSAKPSLNRDKHKMKNLATFKSLALKAKIRAYSGKSRKVSKTKIAILQARLKNIERTKLAEKKVGGRRRRLKLTKQ